jgi:hypothetical protein
MHCRGLAHIVFHNLCAKIAGSTAELGWQCIRRPLLKKTAVDICPLNSNTLTSIKALAHNLFHKICEEAQVDEEVSVGLPGRRSGAGQFGWRSGRRLPFGMGLYQSWSASCLPKFCACE